MTPLTTSPRPAGSRHRQVAAPVAPGSGALRPLGLDDVSIAGGFWAARQRLNHDAIVPHIASWLERTGWLANFDAVAAGTVAATRRGREFSDSEVYKLLEAMAWEIGRTGDEALETHLDAIVARVAAAQHADGYLNTRFGNPGQPARYSQLDWGHELYCYGHLFQAAVARLRTGHRDRLVDVAVRAADHVCAVFGPDGIQGVCGHPEIEPALVELYRATGDERYLAQARLLLDRRGHHTLPDIEFGRGYFQDDVPILEATDLRGHAVRALYLSAGAVDAAVEQDDPALADAVEGQYLRALERRTYLTGGMGSHHQDEAFGDDYELPPDRAYCETCAGVASVMVAWRLLLRTADLRYADVIERTLYNVVAASPREDGKAFFYTNPLQQRVAAQETDPDAVSPRAHAQLRAPWFDVSCCPPNVARTLAQLATYVATASDDGVQLLQFVEGEVTAQLGDGATVRLAVTTRYPDDGLVAVRVVEAPDRPWDLTLRIPAWATGATVEDGGKVAAAHAPGHVVSGLAAGDVVVLRLPLEPRWTHPDPRIDAVRGTVAVERGPLVLCAESVDLPDGVALETLCVDPMLPPQPDGDGAVVEGSSVRFAEPDRTPYGAPPIPREVRSVECRLVPYHRWANRGPSAMRVWLPTT
ncbi:glycoside hydrolase family 127 protein [Luteimicrobium sp. DT211]|uniref:glycoside hydrolase family 127 protein n=1 Tax=Luteimicrobium sp. DT211 TaxID=3393412 RepID=UPI003CE6AC97